MSRPIVNVTAVVTIVLAGVCAIAKPAHAITLGGAPDAPALPSDTFVENELATKDAIVERFVVRCVIKSTKDSNCDKSRRDATDIIKEDLHTLGSSADRAYLPTLLKFFKSSDATLRIAAADAIGMLGPEDADAEILAPLANDPVPDVRHAVAQMLGHGKGPAISALAQRTTSIRAGLVPESPPDPGKIPMPVAPGSSYLFYGSDLESGRLSYLAKDLNEAATFFKGKTKKGPFKLEEFHEKYRFQLEDIQNAMEAALNDKISKLDYDLKPDAANTAAYLEKIQQQQAISMQHNAMLLIDMLAPKIFVASMVYVLEERTIGQRSYPTKYVVLYQDVVLKRPGYRLSWITVSPDAIKAAQAASLQEEREQAAHQKQDDARQKRQEALEEVVKKKDEPEKNKFKKGKADLEKELNF
jgi:hypothetical protein